MRLQNLSKLYLLICSQATATPFYVVESLPSIPTGWTKLTTASLNRLIRLHIAIEHTAHATFERALLEISDPAHPRYGQHLSRSQLKALLRPPPTATSTVLTWLQNNNATEIEDDGEWINFSCTMHQAEKLLDTRFHQYRHGPSGTLSTRALSYSVPGDVRPHVRMIHPTLRFGQPRALSEFGDARSFRAMKGGVERIPAAAVPVGAPIPGGPLNATFCNSTITPECLRALYHIGNYRATPNTTSKLGITGYLSQIPKYADLETSLKKYAPYATGTNFTFVSVNNGSTDQRRIADGRESDTEANLDMQYTIPLDFGSKSIFYSTGGLAPWQADVNFPTKEDDGNEPYLDWLNFMAKVPTEELPQTITTSYGEDEQAIPEAYTRLVCDMLGHLGARGVSIIFASGDNGPGTGCVANFAPHTNQPRFIPNFPGTCPWVTTVGGTEHVAPERAIGLSGGGFSERFPRPSYQDADIPAYISSLPPHFAPFYNAAGRAIPDVAAQARNFALFATAPQTGKSIEGLIGGTSASAPVFASLVSLMNNARLAEGLSPMGFLNPWIYGVGRSGFTDVTVGGSVGCEARSKQSKLSVPAIPGAGWNATAGWDCATGLGTPNFGVMLKLSTPVAAEKHLASGGTFGK